jgi:hypothetical protein
VLSFGVVASAAVGRERSCWSEPGSSLRSQVSFETLFFYLLGVLPLACLARKPHFYLCAWVFYLLLV